MIKTMSLDLGILKVYLSVSLNRVIARIYCANLQGLIDRELGSID